MKFEDWKALKIINENLTISALKSRGEKIRDRIERDEENDFTKLYVLPDFDTFERENEPLQQSILFTDKNIRTFRFNYTTKGELYSVDFWKPTSKHNSDITMYVTDPDMEDIFYLVPQIAKNPSKNVNVNALLAKRSLVESSKKLEVKIEDSKPTKEIVDPAVKKAEKDMDEYDFSDPETIFEDLKTYINMVIRGQQPSLLVTGSPGVGKTFLITKQLKDAGLESGKDYIHVKGRSTAAGMFITLWENNGKIIVFDDCDSVFQSADAVNILKGALDSYSAREISWLVGKPLKTATGENVPKTFEFTGKVIFISNLPQKKIDDAIKSRSFVLEVALTPLDMIKKMRKDLPNVLPEVPLFMRETALSFIERISKKTADLELNMRTLIKAIKIVDEVDDLAVAERLIIQQCSYK
jgi:hypothetical protein